MYTQCPECLTIFKLSGAELAATSGSVRCGHCSAVFDALRTLCEQLPPEPIRTLDTHAAGVAPPQLGLPVFRPNPGQNTLLFDPDDGPRAAERPATPAFTRRRRARKQRNGFWIAGSVLLALLSVVWLTVDRFYEGAVLVVVSNRHGFVASDIVGVLGLIAAVWFWVRPGR